MSVGTKKEVEKMEKFVSVPYVRDVRWDKDERRKEVCITVSVPYVRDVRWDGIR